jgi:uncharacterized membrane-anchored protein
MKDTILKYKVSHVLIRIIAIAQIAYLLLGIFSKRFYEATKLDSDWDAILWMWLLASLLVLPFCVGLEGLWYFVAKSEGRAPKEGISILIDAGLVLVWMIIMFVLMLWGMWHPAWI